MLSGSTLRKHLLSIFQLQLRPGEAARRDVRPDGEQPARPQELLGPRAREGPAQGLLDKIFLQGGCTLGITGDLMVGFYFCQEPVRSFQLVR